MSEAKYQVLSNGKPTTADDPARGIWYSTRCTYWTDNWLALIRVGPGIPACPHCGCPGFQATAGDWEQSARAFEALNPGYLEFIASLKEVCRGKGVIPMKLWEKMIAERAANG